MVVYAHSKRLLAGIKPVADYVHSRNMSFGIYTARGSSTCMGRPGSDGHEALDARTFASWGVDYLKEVRGLCIQHALIHAATTTVRSSVTPAAGLMRREDARNGVGAVRTHEGRTECRESPVSLLWMSPLLPDHVCLHRLADRSTTPSPASCRTTTRRCRCTASKAPRTAASTVPSPSGPGWRKAATRATSLTRTSSSVRRSAA
jgi:hypothetical protein